MKYSTFFQKLRFFYWNILNIFWKIWVFYYADNFSIICYHFLNLWTKFETQPFLNFDHFYKKELFWNFWTFSLKKIIFKIKPIFEIMQTFRELRKKIACTNFFEIWWFSKRTNISKFPQKILKKSILGKKENQGKHQKQK